MYVCVAGNGEMLVFFLFAPNNSLNRPYNARKKGKMLVFTGVYVCVKAKLTLVRFFFAPFPNGLSDSLERFCDRKCM